MPAAQRVILIASYINHLATISLNHHTTHGFTKVAHAVMRSDV
jgi:hypothetical protein